MSSREAGTALGTERHRQGRRTAREPSGRGQHAAGPVPGHIPRPAPAAAAAPRRRLQMQMEIFVAGRPFGGRAPSALLATKAPDPRRRHAVDVRPTNRRLAIVIRPEGAPAGAPTTCLPCPSHSAAVGIDCIGLFCRAVLAGGRPAYAGTGCTCHRTGATPARAVPTRGGLRGACGRRHRRARPGPEGRPSHLHTPLAPFQGLRPAGTPPFIHHGGRIKL